MMKLNLEMLALLKKYFDVVIGSRFAEDGEISRAFSKIREISSKAITIVIKKILNINSTDPLSALWLKR